MEINISKVVPPLASLFSPFIYSFSIFFFLINSTLSKLLTFGIPVEGTYLVLAMI